jgi:hypothetical protein
MPNGVTTLTDDVNLLRSLTHPGKFVPPDWKWQLLLSPAWSFKVLDEGLEALSVVARELGVAVLVRVVPGPPIRTTNVSIALIKWIEMKGNPRTTANPRDQSSRCPHQGGVPTAHGLDCTLVSFTSHHITSYIRGYRTWSLWPGSHHQRTLHHHVYHAHSGHHGLDCTLISFTSHHILHQGVSYEDILTSYVKGE